MNNKRMWVPEIVYEEYDDNGLTDGFPLIYVPNDKEMPNMLFILGARETGEFGPDDNGQPQPITEVEPYQFACMKYLEEALSERDYDKVRAAIGLEKKKIARKKGMEKSKEMLKNISKERK